MAVRTPSGNIISYCTLTEGVTTLLPKTDYIMFMRVEGDRGNMIACGNWDRVAGILGEGFRDLGQYPRRFFCSSFPSEEKLGAIGQEEML
jgi:hypothetical protein